MRIKTATRRAAAVLQDVYGRPALDFVYRLYTVLTMKENDAWDQSDEVVDLEVKRPLDKVIPIRLPSDKWEALRREAREMGIGPTTLARMWLLERLRQAGAKSKSA